MNRRLLQFAPIAAAVLLYFLLAQWNAGEKVFRNLKKRLNSYGVEYSVAFDHYFTFLEFAEHRQLNVLNHLDVDCLEVRFQSLNLNASDSLLLEGLTAERWVMSECAVASGFKIPQPSTIRSIHLSSCQWEQATDLPKLPSLQFLSLAKLPDSSEVGAAILQESPNLQSLHLSEMSINANLVQKIADSKGLTELSLTSCTIDPNSVATSFPNLKELSVSPARSIPDIVELAMRCQKLQSLHLKSANAAAPPQQLLQHPSLKQVWMDAVPYVQKNNAWTQLAPSPSGAR